MSLRPVAGRGEAQGDDGPAVPCEHVRAWVSARVRRSMLSGPMASEPPKGVSPQQRARLSGGRFVLPEEAALTLERANSGMMVSATSDLDGPTESCLDPIESCWERNGMLVVIGVALCLCVVATVVLIVVFAGCGIMSSGGWLCS